MSNIDDVLNNYKSFADELDRQNQDHSKNQETEIEKQGETTPRPVSKLELNQLLSEREKPVLAPTLTPGGSTEQYAHTKTHMHRETRITHIQERLSTMKNKARDDFNMTQQRQDMKEMERDR